MNNIKTCDSGCEHEHEETTIEIPSTVEEVDTNTTIKYPPVGGKSIYGASDRLLSLFKKAGLLIK
jgi:hypothetical protein